MKTKKIIIIFACVLLALFVLGTTDAARVANTAMGEENAPIDDRLIGVFITTKHLDLFDMEGYLNDNAEGMFFGGGINEAESAKYLGRLYATLVEEPHADEEGGETIIHRKYVFDGVEGFSYYCALFSDAQENYRGNSGDEAIADRNMAISSTDAGDSISLEGTVYVATRSDLDTFYYNPIYQTAQGEVYTTTGQGMSYGGDRAVGMSGSYSLNEKCTATENGETVEVGTDIKVSVHYIEAPVSVSVIQLDCKSQVLSRIEYAPNELPNALAVEAGAEYIIVEAHAAGTDGGHTTREMFQRSDEALFSFYCRDDGICVKQYCGLSWGD